MKDVFLVHIILPDYFSQNFYQLIARQRALISQLLENRTILSYSLDMGRKNLWVYIEAPNEQEVMRLIDTFPIIKEVKVKVHELAFFESAPVSLPELNLN